MTDDKQADEPDRSETGKAPEDQPGEVGAEGGSDSARQSKAPPDPDTADDSPLGDTDQHSSG